ncbi:MAG: hypothetical protein Q8O33_14570 [Pseudomonadota bacterium]|jgi:hypothetical protein|nr:hypothetical protein [Pseudomonadota bacterium]
MKRLMLILPLIALAGCASNVALKDASDATRAMGTLTLTWLHSNTMEVTLDGKRYVGEWDSERCFNVECRGDYSNVTKVHRRHIREGLAVLKTKEGDRMDCEWVSHLPDVKGTCRTQDGRTFRLEEAKPTK